MSTCRSTRIGFTFEYLALVCEKHFRCEVGILIPYDSWRHIMLSFEMNQVWESGVNMLNA